MKIILAIDIGFVASGVAIMGYEVAWRPLSAVSIHPRIYVRKQGVRVADRDVVRAQDMIRPIIEIMRTRQPVGIMVEFPHAGARGARANRCMGIATGLIVGAAEALGITIEPYTPNETRIAATGSMKASKDAVVAAMRAKWTEFDFVSKNTKPDQEAIADALATFEAGRYGLLARMCAQ